MQDCFWSEPCSDRRARRLRYIAIAEVPVAVNQGFIALKCDNSLSAHFAMRLDDATNLMRSLSRAGGTTFAEISKAAFRPLPPGRPLA